MLQSNCKNKLVFIISSKLFRKTRNKHCFFATKTGLVVLLTATQYLLTNR